MKIVKAVLCFIVTFTTIVNAQNDTLKINALLDSAAVKQYVDLDAQYRYASEAFALSAKINYSKGIAASSYEIGICNFDKGNYNDAFSYLLKCHKVSKEHNFSDYELKALNGLGLVFMDKSEDDKAILYFNEGIEKALQQKNEKALGNFYTNIANSYNNLKLFDKSLEIQFKTLALLQKLNKPQNLAMLYNNIGNTLKYKKMFDKALPYYQRSLSLLDSIQDKTYSPTVMCNIAECYDYNKDFGKAEDTYKKAEAFSKELGNVKILTHVYFKIISFYEGHKRYKETVDYYNLYFESNLLMFNTEKEEIEKELLTKYQTEQKEQENVILQKENNLSAEKINRQKIFSYYIISALILALGLIFFIFRSYRLKQKANLLIIKQKHEVEAQKLIVEEKNHLIEEKQKEIIDSINYAKRIQVALLAHKDVLDANLKQGNYFVYFQPKDIVSGDFYWATEHNGKFYLAVCDSTGHGVPGAFMSLLNMGFLSEAIKEKGIEKPNEIFDYVRTRLINSISGEGQKDGMDGILICYDKTHNLLEYAAANNAPVLVRHKEVTELEKDRMPVGKGELQGLFKLFSFDIQKEDVLYLYTDGYADQFGGPKGKKFKYRQLNELLLGVSTESSDVQTNNLNRSLNNWKGSLEQVDDVLIIGIRF